MAGASLGVAAGVLLSGCADTCGATLAKLATLQRGMSYDETSRIMGCYGRSVSPRGSTKADVSVLEWNGPGSILLVATQVDFIDDRLLYYTTYSRTGF
jgi:hypothetical protein